VPVVACFVLGLCSSGLAQSTPPSQQAADPAAAASPVSTFAVLEFAIEGNTVLPEAAVEKAVTPFLGEGKTFAAVEAARAALEKAYQDAGYLTVFVDLPEQEISAGVVTLQVLEGKVERLAITGSRYFSQGYIRSRVPELAEGKVPNFNVVQAQLAVVNRTEDRRVQPVLRPGHAPSTAEVELKVTDEVPMHASVELNNNHAQFNKPWRTQASVRYDNLFQSDHTLQLTAITAPQDPSLSTVLAMNYTMPELSGDNWQLSALWSNSQIEALSAATIVGKGFNLGVHRQWVLPSVGGLTHSLNVGADYKDMKESTLVGSDRLSTPLRYMPLSASHAGTVVQEDGAVTSWTHSLVFGVSSLLYRQLDCGYGQQDQFACKREGADGGFSYLKFDVRHSQPVGQWSLGVHVSAQLASQALVGGEQFALGGADSVRGYLSAEAVGDHGMLGSLQLNTPNLKTVVGTTTSLDELTAYAFVDGGFVRVINPSAAQAGLQSLSAVGLGARVRAFKAWSLSLDLAHAFKAATVTQSGDNRLHVRLAADF
jgi:hemolysin activation/secretion protein